MRAADADCQVGQHDMQEAAGAGQGLGQVGADRQPRQRNSKLPTRIGWANRPKVFVVQLAVQAVVQGRVAVDGDAAAVSAISMPAREQGRWVDLPTTDAGQHAGDKPHGDSGLRALGRVEIVRCTIFLFRSDEVFCHCSTLAEFARLSSIPTMVRGLKRPNMSAFHLSR